jgi:hypothetical protein
MKIPENKFHYYGGPRTFVALKSNLEEMPDIQFEIMIGDKKFFIEDELHDLKTDTTVFWKYRSEDYKQKAYIYNE